MDVDSLKAVSFLPKSFQGIFPFRYFNSVQSEVFSQVYDTDGNTVVSAPTGCGKTVLFELGILRVLKPFITEEETLIPPSGRAKVVYVAPMKALIQERLKAWMSSFGRIGVLCEELSGDNGSDDLGRLSRADIILTTPEKFDSLTRRNRHLGGLSWIGDVSLLLIDEVHLLSDPRGAALEAVVCRMKMISMYPEMKEYPISRLRIIAVSATIPNIHDIAEWLKATGPGIRRFGEEVRPVRLTSHVVGYAPAKNDFLFERKLQQFLPDIIRRHSHGKPTLVFCSTRKGARDAALHLSQAAPGLGFIRSTAQGERLQMSSVTATDKQLQACIKTGVGFHNGGLEHADRALVEGLFLRGDLHALCTTGTLAVGVNLPAHLVIIKSTQYFNKEQGGYLEYERSAVLQMAGRAGRPQFDDSGTVVIMTRQDTVHLYQNLLTGSEPIESGLLGSITEHLNAEIVLLTVTDVSLAIDWLKHSFLYVRLRKNPSFYGLPQNLTDEQLKMKLRGICLSSTRALAEFGMLTTDDDGFLLRPAEPGRLMAHSYLSFKTMQAITQVVQGATEDALLWVIAEAPELAWIKLRRSEKKLLNYVNLDKTGRVKFQVQDGSGRPKKRIQSDKEKVFILVNDSLSGEPAISDFTMSQDVASICSNGSRIANCMARYFIWCRRFSEATAALRLAKFLSQKLWGDSQFLLRQLPGIGNVTAKALVTAGLGTFNKLQQADPRKLEVVTGRKYPFGNQIKEALSSLPPQVELTVKCSEGDLGSHMEVILARPQDPLVRGMFWADLVVGDEGTNTLLYHERMRTDTFASPYIVSIPAPKELAQACRNLHIIAALIHEKYVGLDCVSSTELGTLKADGKAQRPRSYAIVTRLPEGSTKSPLQEKPQPEVALEDGTCHSTTPIVEQESLPDLDAPSFELHEHQERGGSHHRSPGTRQDFLKPESDGATQRNEWKEECRKRHRVPSEAIFQHIANKSSEFPPLRSSFIPHARKTEGDPSHHAVDVNAVRTPPPMHPGGHSSETAPLLEDWGTSGGNHGCTGTVTGMCADGKIPSFRSAPFEDASGTRIRKDGLYCSEWSTDAHGSAKSTCSMVAGSTEVAPPGPQCGNAKLCPPVQNGKGSGTSHVAVYMPRSIFDDLFDNPVHLDSSSGNSTSSTGSKTKGLPPACYFNEDPREPEPKRQEKQAPVLSNAKRLQSLFSFL